MKQSLKNVIFLYNPISGEAQVVSQLDTIARHYQRAGYVLSLFRITREHELKGLSQLIEHLKPEHLLVAGGDGTINRLVNYLVNHDCLIPLALLPMGTANDFAHMIGMPNNLSSACRAILNGRLEYLDMGRVNDRYFVNVLSCGLFTDISQRTPTALKNTFGKLAYYVSSISEIPTFRKMNITVEADEISFKGTCLFLDWFRASEANDVKIGME